MKKTGVILGTLFKRLMHRKGLLLCFLAMPMLILSMQALEQSSKSGIRAGIYMEADTEWNEKLAGLLTDTQEQIQFVRYQDLEAMQQDIVAERIECGYILQEDLQNRMGNKKWNNSVIVYESAHSMLTPIINEAFFQKIFTLVSGEWFEGYVANHEAYSEVERKELLAKVREGLQDQLENGNTFHAEHIYVDTAAGYTGGTDTQADTGEDAAAGRDGQVFPVRGIAAVMIFVCGLIGIFDCIADRKEGPFLIMGKRLAVHLLDIALPVAAAAVIALLTFFFAGEWKGMVEIPGIFVYSILVIFWCFLFSLPVRSEKTMAVWLPVFVLCSLILTPVFLDLGTFIPVFRLLEKWLPVTYYLRYF